ncbi:MAG TPA: cytochrome c oxidase subunit II [Gammaproteobacteria bacterium]|nr:cytochrome c oxidase subunit II [Gammaproteobacteria bacterium]
MFSFKRLLKPRRGGFLPGLLALILPLVSGAVLADWELNMPRGVTERSAEVYELHMLVFWICVIIGVIVFGAMIWSIFFHRKSRGAKAAKFHHNTLIEVIWTTIPFLILIGMAIPAARTLIEIENYAGSDISIKVTGYQWKWRYDYLFDNPQCNFGFFSTMSAESNRARQLGAEIPLESVDHYLRDVDHPLVVPVNTKVHLLLTAADVIHSWWVPMLGGKRDAIPGFVNDWWFKAEEIGVYRGQCAELCGRGHAYMPIVVRVVSQEDYDAWLEERMGSVEDQVAANAAAIKKDWSKEELLAEGEKVYGKFCAACHGAQGEGIPAMGAPALAGSPIATGAIDGHVDTVLHGVPGTTMVAWGPTLSDLQIAAVITYERNAFGNTTGDVIQPADIAAAKASGANE